MEAKMSIEVFTSTGAVRTSYDEAELAALSPDRRARHKKLVSAAQEAESAEANLKTATDAVHAAVREHAGAVEALDRVRPKPTFFDLWKQTFQG
jgi:hypothetical protein